MVATTSVTVAPSSPVKQFERGADSGGKLVYHACSNVSLPTRHPKVPSVMRSVSRVVQRADSARGGLVAPVRIQCGGILFSAPTIKPEVVFLKVGLIEDEDFMNSLGLPKMDVYCKRMWSWEKPIEGALAAQTFPGQ